MHLLRLAAIGFSISLLGCYQGVPQSSSRESNAVEWQEYESAEGKFGVKMPGKPKQTEQGGYKIHEVVLREPSFGYYVHHATFPGLLNFASPEAKLKTYQEKTIKKDFPEGVVVKVNDLQQGEHPGKEFILVVKGGDIIRRVYMTNDRVYLVTVSGKNLTPSSSRVEPFFESFTIR